MSRRFLVRFTAAAALIAAVGGCAPATETTTPASAGCIAEFDPDTDYFPDKSTVSDANNFTLSYHNSYQILTVNRPSANGRSESYVLVRCGAPAPQLSGDLAGARRITVPIRSLYSASTTHLGMIGELGRTEVLTGVADAAHVVSPKIRQRIDTGEIVDYAPGRQVNVEKVIAARPDVLITEGIDDPSYPKLRDAGIDVVANSEWLETTPLGRAEWIKVFAALTGTEKNAGEAYGRLRDNYRRIGAATAGVRPVDVLPGAMYQGSWSMPAGGDYAGRLILDAGGRYPWAGDNGTGGLQLNFESVYAKAGRARLWLINSDWETLDDVLASDSRHGELAAVRHGQVWSASKAVGATGGNDYWERGVARPDLVLADLAAILHPDVEPDHRFEFYRQLTR
jgi:iron complex transport system substrate-binding protein